MEQGLPKNIEKLIADLKDQDAYVRKVAAGDLGQANVIDDRILTALNDVVAVEKNKVVRQEAAHAYLILAQRPAPASTNGQGTPGISDQMPAEAVADEQIRLLRELVRVEGEQNGLLESIAVRQATLIFTLVIIAIVIGWSAFQIYILMQQMHVY